jgi:hypothetical protein
MGVQPGIGRWDGSSVLPARVGAADLPDRPRGKRHSEADKLGKLVLRIGLFEGRVVVHEFALVLRAAFGRRKDASPARSVKYRAYLEAMDLRRM